MPKKLIRIPLSSPNDHFVMITKLRFKDGDKVKKDDVIAEIEATKTEIEIVSDFDGQISYSLKEGQQAEVNDVLATVTSDSISESEVVTSAGKITRKAQKLMKDLHLDPSRFSNSTVVREADVRKAVYGDYRPLEQTFTKRLEVAVLEKAQANLFASDVSIRMNVPMIEKRAKTLAGNDFILSVPELISFHVLKTLSDFPELNGFYDGEAYSYSKIRLGFALNVGQGLKVATIGEMNSPSLKVFCSSLQELLAKYLRNELSPAELSGSTFTISNMYSMDVEDFTPLINARQGAILGISSQQPDQTVRLKLRFDHRMTDGQRAAEFLRKLAENVLNGQ